MRIMGGELQIHEQNSSQEYNEIHYLKRELTTKIIYIKRLHKYKSRYDKLLQFFLVQRMTALKDLRYLR